jgi:hypothetical protein
MKTRIANFNFETGTFPLVEINMTKVHLTDESTEEGTKITALTEHTVAAVKMVGGVEVVKVLQKYNHPFEYAGGNPFVEAFTSLNAYLADPTT